MWTSAVNSPPRVLVSPILAILKLVDRQILGKFQLYLNSVPIMGSKELKSYFTFISFCKGDEAL